LAAMGGRSVLIVKIFQGPAQLFDGCLFTVG
jgi:hypothetical protein